MRITIVSQYYSPEPAPIPVAVARGLLQRGHQVVVLTGYPNYPSGKLMAGYRQTWGTREHIDNVAVRRVPLFISHSRRSVGRLLNYASFAISAVLGAGSARRADVVYVYATQMTAAVAPAWWNRVRGVPFVLHIQDLWPESITGSTMSGGRVSRRLIEFVLNRWLPRMYTRAAATIGIGVTMSRMLVDRGVPRDRIHTVFNWSPDTPANLSHGSDRAGQVGRGLRVMYAGNIGEMQDLETVVRAAALVSDLQGFAITILGSGASESSVQDLAVELAATNVSFEGRVAQADMASQYAASDFQLVTLKNLPLFEGTIPSKFQSSLAHGVPVITSVAGEVRELVESRRLGFVSSPENPADLAAVFRAAYLTTPAERRGMSERARAFYDQEMSEQAGIDAIERILVGAAGRNKNGRP